MTPTCTPDVAPAGAVPSPGAPDVVSLLHREGTDVVDLALLERLLAGLDRL